MGALITGGLDSKFQGILPQVADDKCLELYNGEKNSEFI